MRIPRPGSGSRPGRASRSTIRLAVLCCGRRRAAQPVAIWSSVPSWVRASSPTVGACVAISGFRRSISSTSRRPSRSFAVSSFPAPGVGPSSVCSTCRRIPDPPVGLAVEAEEICSDARSRLVPRPRRVERIRRGCVRRLRTGRSRRGGRPPGPPRLLAERRGGDEGRRGLRAARSFLQRERSESEEENRDRGGAPGMDGRRPEAPRPAPLARIRDAEAAGGAGEGGRGHPGPDWR